jgi:hypothetical protein
VVLTQGVFVGDDTMFEAACAALGVPSGVDRLRLFEPHGLSLVRWAPGGDPWMVALHSWPEHRLVSVDCYGSQLLPDLEERLGRIGWVESGAVRSGAERPPRPG